MNNIIFIVISVIAILLVINSVRKKIFSIKESFWWFAAAIIMLLLSIFPYSIDWIAVQLHIAYPPSLLFVICIIFLAFINFRNSQILSRIQNQVTDLAQELAILKSKIDSNKYN